jgi:hypothetical protein
MKYIAIKRPNGTITIVRSEAETPSEDPLTEHEKIINELSKLLLDAVSVSVQVPKIKIQCNTCGHAPCMCRTPLGFRTEH